MKILSQENESLYESQRKSGRGIENSCVTMILLVLYNHSFLSIVYKN